jgi:SAM-dependent methyltransferase
MIARAREAARARGLDIPLHNEPLQSAARIGGPFDAALSLFASVNYLTSMRDLRAALENVAALLEPGGLFVFDFWNGNAVLRDYSPVRVLRKARGDREVLRVSETSLDRLRNVATVRFDFTLFEGHCRLDRFQEEHRIRYHFPQDMQDHLDAAGFDLVHACPFMEPDAPLGETDWNVTFVGRKRA